MSPQPPRPVPSTMPSRPATIATVFVLPPSRPRTICRTGRQPAARTERTRCSSTSGITIGPVLVDIGPDGTDRPADRPASSRGSMPRPRGWLGWPAADLRLSQTSPRTVLAATASSTYPEWSRISLAVVLATDLVDRAHRGPNEGAPPPARGRLDRPGWCLRRTNARPLVAPPKIAGPDVPADPHRKVHAMQLPLTKAISAP